MRRYRVDFALITLTGNLTRYLTLRRIVAEDASVTARWFPIRTWVEGDWLRFLPGEMRVRARHLLDTWWLFVSSPADAILIHAFETYPLYALLRRVLRRKTIIVNNSDGWIPPAPPGWRGWLRRNAVAQTALFVPWTGLTARDIATCYPQVPLNRIVRIHPGIDLSLWTQRPYAAPGERFRLLFVAGNLLLKGADTLLDAFVSGLSEHCDLDVATQTAYLPEEFKARLLTTPHVHLHLDLRAGSPELRALYASADAFVSPSNSDTSSWVALEAQATGIPVIITPMGGIPEIVRDGETGLLIPPRDPQALTEAVERLRQDEALRLRLIEQGRAHVEAEYDARKNTERLLSLMKALIDGQPLPVRTEQESAVVTQTV